MGLDVSVYQNVRITKSEDDYSFMAFVIDDAWKYKINNLVDGAKYTGDATHADVSYPYGAHNRFREDLLRLTGRSDLLTERGRIDWDALERESSIPFFELLFFADNEGCLDHSISDTLYRNFLEWLSSAEKFCAEDGYTLGKYKDWLRVFSDGKQEGSVVVFH